MGKRIFCLVAAFVLSLALSISLFAQGNIVKPDLAPVSFAVLSNSVAFYPPSPRAPTVMVNYAVTNQGGGWALNYWWDRVCVSTNKSLSGVVCSQDLLHWTTLPSGTAYQENVLVNFPKHNGTYWLILQANAYNSIQEENTDNNLLVATEPVAVTYQVVPPDLAPLSVVALSNTVAFNPPSPQSPSVPVVCTVTNQGAGVAGGYWEDLVCVSTNSSLSGVVSSQYFYCWSSPLEEGTVYRQTNIVSLPQKSGTFWLFFQANGSSLYEENKSNNVMAAAEPVTVIYQVVPPDLVPLSVTMTTNSVAFHPPRPQSPTVVLTTAVKNEGLGVDWSSWNDRVYVSTNENLSGAVSSQYLWYGGSLAAGEVYQQTNIITLPQQSGTYWLIFQANGYGSLYEENQSNNVMVTANSITVTYQVVPPDLAPLTVAMASNTVVFYPPSPKPPTVALAYSVTNQGAGSPDLYWVDRVYVSTNQTLSGALYWQDFTRGPSLSAGEVYRQTNLVNLPQWNGTYWLIVEVDAYNYLYENNLNNNVMAAGEPVAVTYQVIPPDLAPLGVRAATNSVVFCPLSPQSPTVPVIYSVTNQGAGAACDFWYDRVCVSTNSTMDGVVSSQYFNDLWQFQLLFAGDSYERTNVVNLPQQSGTYWLIIEVNRYDYLYEKNLSNNIMVAAQPVIVTYKVVPPDLAPLNIDATSNIVAVFPPSPQAPTVSVSYAITNMGAGVASKNWYDRVYVSIDGTMAGAVSLQEFHTWDSEPLPQGGVYERTNLVELPQQSGTYWLIIQANYYGYLFEENLSNNVLVSAKPVKLSYQVVPPDLTTANVATLTNSVAFFPDSPQSPTVALAYSVLNQGAGVAEGGWQDRVCVSTNGTMDGVVIRQEIARSSSLAPIPSGGAYKGVVSVNLPQRSGTYWLIFQANSSGLYEEMVNNNALMATVPVTVTYGVVPADLVASSVDAVTNTVVSIWSSLQNPSVPVVCVVSNQGANVTSDYWFDRVYVSTNATIDGAISSQDFFRGDFLGLPSGASYQETNLVTLPFGDETYWLIFQANYYGDPYEENLSNNVKVATMPVTVTNVVVISDLAALSVVPISNSVTFYPAKPTVPTVPVICTVTNQGPGVALGEWYDVVYVSTNETISGAISSQEFYESWYTELPSGGVYQRTNIVELPQQSGTYWIIFEANSYGMLHEQNFDNNRMSAANPVVLTYKVVPPDLVPIFLNAPSPVVGANSSMTVVCGVTNQGAGQAAGEWLDQLFLSTNKVIDHNAVEFGYFHQTQTVGAGGCYWRTNTVRLPGVNSGHYYLLLSANVSRSYYLYEANVTNNVMAVPVELQVLRGSLQVVLNPPEALQAGGKWNIDDGPWLSSGVTCSNLVVGTHIVKFSAVNGWTAPGNRSVTILPAQITTVTGNYGGIRVVAFADANLEAMVRYSLEKPTGNLTTVDLNSLTWLYCYGMGITNLSGLEYAVNLNSVQAGGNLIHDLTPLSGLGNLYSLDLSSNPLSDCSVLTNLTGLGALCLNGTSFTNFAFVAGLTSLGTLELADNQIRDASVLLGLTNLHSLDLSGNPIRDWEPLSHLTQLTELYLSGASLTNIDFLRPLAQLTALSLADNRISDLSPLQDLRSLSTLHLSGCHLNNLSALSGLSELQHLDVQKNWFTDLASLNTFPKLRSLMVNDNLLNLDYDTPSMNLIQELWLHGVQVQCWPQHQPPMVGWQTNWTIPANSCSELCIDSSDFSGRPEHLFLKSSNTDLLPDSMIAVSDVIPDYIWHWTLSLTPMPNQVGTTILCVSVLDDWGLTTNVDINVTVEWPTNVTIADPNLELAIRSTLNKPKGDLTTVDLKNLIWLNAESSNIKSLSGLEGAVNVYQLCLAGNFIADVSPLAGLTHLQIVNLATNSLTNIDVLQQLPQIQTVDLTENWLDVGPGSRALGVIQDLTNRNVTVAYQFQKIPSRAVPSIGDALEMPLLTWTSGGNAAWFAQTTTTWDGAAAAQSGPIANGQDSWLQTTVRGPGNLTFWWMVSSENNFDRLEFYTNGIIARVLCGDTGWLKESYPLCTGTNVLTWRYRKDDFFSWGLDGGFLDKITVTPYAPSISLNGAGILPDGHFQLGINGVEGDVVEIQARTNLSAGEWLYVATVTNHLGAAFFIDPANNKQQMFYRLKLWRQ